MAVRRIKRKNPETGKAEKSDSWYIFFSDHHGREHSFSAGADRGAAQALESQVKKLVSARLGSHYPPEMQDWIDHLPNTLKERFAKWDLLSGCRIAVTKPLKEHLTDWHKTQKASGITKLQADILFNRAERLFADCGFRYLKDISGSKVLQAIERLRKTIRTKEGLKDLGPASGNTKRYFLRACKQFCGWTVKDGRTSTNPLQHLSRTAEVQNKRRALTPEEIECLLDYTKRAGLNFSITGPERALVYRLAIESGLRANEINSLKRTSFDFEGLKVKLEGKHAKNRKEAVLPLKTATAELIKEHLKAKMPTASAFRIPKGNTARMIQKDLKETRKAWIKKAVNNPDEHRRRNDSDFLKVETIEGKVDFHSLRHTFGTLLASAGIHPKTAQELMRHSDINLTMSRYTHAQADQITAAINALPEFEHQAAVKTGTDDISADAIGFETPESNTPKITPIQSAKGSIYQHKSAKAINSREKIESQSLIHRIGENEQKTAVLTGKQGSDMMPSNKVPVAQLDRVLASEAKGCRFESRRGR